ncbi:hypothetical protein jhhlp_003643 [Lomentospora prolificans]|uniref:Cytochrome P450 n=1 Tax=Lomentospora prolificans TaxID=41688 RepID=A0A2N3N9C6_9PEZI|nr:hypothetical protein jhhlp_003643 [Lomentospora prolificans]
MDHDGLGLLHIAACCVLIPGILAFFWRDPSRRRSCLPPGPPGELLLGHLRVIPKSGTAIAYANWSREYKSDVIYLKSLGQPIVVLNSTEAAVQLLGRRATNYSDRPRFTLFEVMGWGATLTFLPFGPQWRMHRKLLQANLSPSKIRQWHGLQVQESRRAAASMLAHDGTWNATLKRFSVAIVLMVSYGIQIDTDDDEYVKIANDALYVTGNGGLPAGSIVDLFPLARYLPDWLVRDWPLKFAREWGWAIRKLHDVPFAAVEAEVDDGIIRGSLAHALLREYRSTKAQGMDRSFSLNDIKGASGAIFIAGADTTWATLVVFMLCMVLNPEVQEKAHAQLDSVLGPDRLPDFDDRPRLPYIDLILQEVFRWAPLAPLGIPHKSLEDDIYKGMLIPRVGVVENTGAPHIAADPPWITSVVVSSIVFANTHAMSRDERVYKDPARFNPDRYNPLADGTPGEPRPVAHFGFGRRQSTPVGVSPQGPCTHGRSQAKGVFEARKRRQFSMRLLAFGVLGFVAARVRSCVGQFLADNSCWMAMATVLAAFRIDKKHDEQGRIVEPTVKFTNGGTWSDRAVELLGATLSKG